MSVDEMLHLLGHHSHRERGNLVFAVFGHIANYDPASHTVTVVLPVQRDLHDVPVMTPQIPLGSLWVGNGFGIQIRPHGGATLTNPTAGEQCVVLVIEQDVGIAVVACLCYTAVMPPPGNLQPGEILIKHESGTLIQFLSSGALAITGASGQNINLAVSGGGIVKVNGGAHAVARVGDLDSKNDTIVTGSSVLFTD
jgi:phage baseplate assembly protein gpV